MADNKDSYTYKRYISNKKWLYLIKIFYVVYVFIVLLGYLIYSQTTKVNLFTPAGIIIIPFVMLISLKYVKKSEREINKILKFNYRTWGKGAGAELSIANALEALPQDYKIISDFNTGRGNIDFIVVGPKGIFTIECKANEGQINLINGQIYCNGKVVERDYIRQTIAEKLWLTEKLKLNFNHFYTVTGLLEFPKGKINTGNIHGEIQGIWIGGYKFHEYLINKSNNNLSNEEIEKIYTYLSTEKNSTA